MSLEKKSTVYIVGFAPSWKETPWSDSTAERWGMNSLHKVAGDKPWTRWFQLHDIDLHHKTDKAEHIAWLRDSGLPVYLWPEHMDRWDIPNAIPYPKSEVLDRFGNYFNNSVSWMIAVAILEGFTKIGVYGVDMAADTEYGHQRPSCEYMIGVARGLGIEVEIPVTSDLLKTPFLYGAEDHHPHRLKMEARLKDLESQRQNMEAQIGQLQAQHQQTLGAIADVQYWLRSWSIPASSGGKAT